MILLLKVFADIAFFRRGPEDLPASSFLFMSSLLAYAVGSVLTSMVHTEEATLIFLQVLVDISLMLFWFASLLIICHRRTRVQQTMTALFGTGALLYFVAFLMMSWFQSQIDGSTGAQPPNFPLIAIWMWSVVVAGHIVHRALEIPLIAGTSISFVYSIASMVAFNALFVTGA